MLHYSTDQSLDSKLSRDANMFEKKKRDSQPEPADVDLAANSIRKNVELSAKERAQLLDKVVEGRMNCFISQYVPQRFRNIRAFLLRKGLLPTEAMQTTIVDLLKETAASTAQRLKSTLAEKLTNQELLLYARLEDNPVFLAAGTKLWQIGQLADETVSRQMILRMDMEVMPLMMGEAVFFDRQTAPAKSAQTNLDLTSDLDAERIQLAAIVVTDRTEAELDFIASRELEMANASLLRDTGHSMPENVQPRFSAIVKETVISCRQKIRAIVAELLTIEELSFCAELQRDPVYQTARAKATIWLNDVVEAFEPQVKEGVSAIIANFCADNVDSRPI